MNSSYDSSQSKMLAESKDISKNNASDEITYYIEHDLAQCEKMWRALVNPRYFTEVWEYRLIFHETFSKKPYFICAKQNEKIIAFLPLEYLELEGGYYSFFGAGRWNERLCAYYLPNLSPNIINKIIELVPKPFSLHSMTKEFGVIVPNAVPETDTYYINGEQLQYNIDNLFQNMSKDTRQSVKRYLRIFNEMNPLIEYDRFDDYHDMVELNIKRFGQDSTFNKPFFGESIEKIIQSPVLRPHLRMISVRINGVLETCALCANFNSTYIYLASGTNPDIENLPKYLVSLIIKDGLQLQAKTLFMLCYDCGWKDRWRINKEPLYILEK
jgi:hypothetical protein